MPTATKPTNKQLEILYFANLAEQASKDEEKIQFAGEDLTDLYQMLSEKYDFKLTQDKLAVAINHEMTRWDTPINDGDIIAFIPPVAGG